MVAGAALVVVGAAFLLRPERPKQVEPQQPLPQQPLHRAESPVAALQASAAIPSAPLKPHRAKLPFGFAGIDVEKSSLCRGEQTLIRVRPRHENEAEAAWLTPVVGSTRGWQVPWGDLISPPGRYQVPVRLESADGSYVEKRVAIEIRDCTPAWVLMVSDRELPSRGGETHELSAMLLSGGGNFGADPSAAASYLWDFDDGEQVASTERTVIHDFPAEEARAEGDGAEHTYLVRVRALDVQGGELATGMKELNQRNAFAALKRQGHRLQLKADYSPLPDDGVLAFVLRNIDGEETAHLDRVQLRLIGCDNEEKETRQAAATDLLEATSVPPRGSVKGRLTWRAAEREGICFVDASLSGRSEPGDYEVVTYLSMTVGRRPETVTVPSDHTALLDEAARLLGHPRAITLRDIQRLEEEGKLPRGVLSRP